MSQKIPNWVLFSSLSILVIIAGVLYVRSGCKELRKAYNSSISYPRYVGLDADSGMCNLIMGELEEKDKDNRNAQNNGKPLSKNQVFQILSNYKEPLGGIPLPKACDGFNRDDLFKIEWGKTRNLEISGVGVVKAHAARIHVRNCKNLNRGEPVYFEANFYKNNFDEWAIQSSDLASNLGMGW